tara:strand:- start:189 stop:371 length:183 start_codon:yes stop_codon:yes gene_type:complete
MDSTTFWLWTLLIAFFSFFLTRAFCDCCRNYPSIMDRRYIIFKNADKELLPIKKIDHNNA